MKLKNKKTGEIVEAVIVDHGAEWELELRNAYTNEDTQTYDSLAKLNEEWEDVPEEPKEIHIEGIQKIYRDMHGKVSVDYATAKEAEKAVEKLKAWKRLKDKGFRVIDYGDEDIRYEIKDRYDGCLFDLETVLFGGKE